MERLTRTMIRHRWAVISTWAVIFVVSGWTMSGLSKLLTNRFSIPGSDTAHAEKILQDEYGRRSDGSFQIVARATPGGSAAQIQPAVAAAAARAVKVVPTGKLVGVQRVSDTTVQAIIVSNLEPADAKGYTKNVREAIGQIPGAETYVTGAAAVTYDTDKVFARDAKVGELYTAIPLALPVFSLEVGPGTNKGIPHDLESVRGLNILSAELGEGATAPTDVIVDTHRTGGVRTPDVQAALQRLTRQVEPDPEGAAVSGAHSPASALAANGRYLHMQIVGEHEYGSPQEMDFVTRFRDQYVPRAGFPSSADVYAGGGPPSSVDVIDTAYGAFPWLVLVVLVLTYFLLLRAFRSLLLPLKAIILNLLSIGAAYGLLVAFFKWGGGEALGLIQYDQITGWIPVFLFAMLFGLSMDYEVFLVSRMREEWDRTKDNAQAISLGLAKTGRLVTAAGLIMFAAFMGFVAGSFVDLQQFGFGLAAAILIDVTIVRALLLPSAMRLFGRWNWWLPEGIARVV